MLEGRQADDGPATLELRIGDEPVVLESRDGEVNVSLGETADPDAALVGSERPVLGLLLGYLSLEQSGEEGVEVIGDRSVVERFVPQPFAR
jgi:hypothetical protein